MRRRDILVCSAILFFVACLLPVFEFRHNENGVQTMTGGEVLAIGWLGIFLGHVGWLANPLLWLAGLLMIWGRRRSSIACSILAALLSIETFALFGSTIPGDEADVNKLYLQRLGLGTYFWYASILVVLLGGFVYRSKAAPQTNQRVSTGDLVGDAWEK